MKKRTLSDMAIITMGQSPDSSSYNENCSGLPFFQGNAGFGDVHPHTQIFCSSPKKTAIPGDVLISVRAPIGAVNIADQKCCIGRGLAAITPLSDSNTGFIFYFLKSKTKILQSKGTGTTFKAIGKDILGKLSFPDYPLSQQKQIAMRLDKIQELVSLQKEQIRKLEQLVKSRFLEMFGDPITNPKGWKVKSLATVSPIDSKKTLHSNDTSWLLNLDKIESNTGRIIKKDIVPVSQIGNSVYCFQKGQVLYSKLRPYLNKVVLADEDGFCTSELLPLKPKEELCAVFLLFLLRSKSIVNFLSNKVAGAKMPRVDMGTFKSMPIVLPPLPLQKQFAEFVEKTEAQKALLEKRLNRLETLYKSLMQEYFGEYDYFTIY